MARHRDMASSQWRSDCSGRRRTQLRRRWRRPRRTASTKVKRVAEADLASRELVVHGFDWGTSVDACGEEEECAEWQRSWRRRGRWWRRVSGRDRSCGRWSGGRGTERAAGAHWRAGGGGAWEVKRKQEVERPCGRGRDGSGARDLERRVLATSEMAQRRWRREGRREAQERPRERDNAGFRGEEADGAKKKRNAERRRGVEEERRWAEMEMKAVERGGAH